MVDAKMSFLVASTNATDKHGKQQKMVTGYSGAKHDMPGDFNNSPSSVPDMPGGIEKFESYTERIENSTMPTVGYLSVLTGISCLFMASVRLMASKRPTTFSASTTS